MYICVCIHLNGYRWLHNYICIYIYIYMYKYICLYIGTCICTWPIKVTLWGSSGCGRSESDRRESRSYIYIYMHKRFAPSAGPNHIKDAQPALTRLLGSKCQGRNASQQWISCPEQYRKPLLVRNKVRKRRIHVDDRGELCGCSPLWGHVLRGQSATECGA